MFLLSFYILNIKLHEQQIKNILMLSYQNLLDNNEIANESLNTKNQIQKYVQTISTSYTSEMEHILNFLTQLKKDLILDLFKIKNIIQNTGIINRVLLKANKLYDTYLVSLPKAIDQLIEDVKTLKDSKMKNRIGLLENEFGVIFYYLENRKKNVQPIIISVREFIKFIGTYVIRINRNIYDKLNHVFKNLSDSIVALKNNYLFGNVNPYNYSFDEKRIIAANFTRIYKIIKRYSQNLAEHNDESKNVIMNANKNLQHYIIMDLLVISIKTMLKAKKCFIG